MLQQIIVEKYFNTGIKLACNQCDYKVGTPRFLKKHIRMEHEGDLYTCPYCEFKTKTDYSIKKHVKISHEEPGDLYSCRYCEFNAKRNRNLEKHVRLKHKGESFNDGLYQGKMEEP